MKNESCRYTHVIVPEWCEENTCPCHLVEDFQAVTMGEIYYGKIVSCIDLKRPKQDKWQYWELKDYRQKPKKKNDKTPVAEN